MINDLTSFRIQKRKNYLGKYGTRQWKICKHPFPCLPWAQHLPEHKLLYTNISFKCDDITLFWNKLSINNTIRFKRNACLMYIPYNDDIDQPQHLHCLNRVFYLQQPCKNILYDKQLYMYLSEYFFPRYTYVLLEWNLQLFTMDHKIHIFFVHIFFALFNVDPQTSRGSTRQICGYEQATRP